MNNICAEITCALRQTCGLTAKRSPVVKIFIGAKSDNDSEEYTLNDLKSKALARLRAKSVVVFYMQRRRRIKYVGKIYCIHMYACVRTYLFERI